MIDPSLLIPRARKSVTDDLPDFVPSTNRVKVEPFHSLSEKAWALYDGFGDGDFFDDVTSDLYDIYTALHDLAWQSVPNPAYDKERAEAFCATHPTRCGTRFYVGQSYTPLTPEEREKTLSWIEANQ